MYKAKKVIILLAVLVFSTSSLFAQLGAVSEAAEVTINIKPALSITASSQGVDFGDVLMTESGIKTVNPVDGALFTITGHNSGDVLITFPETLVLNAGTETLDFDPYVESTLTSSYAGQLEVNNGDRENMSTTGELYLWLGGTIDVTDAEQGDYLGSFPITVAY